MDGYHAYRCVKERQNVSGQASLVPALAMPEAAER